MSYKGIFEIPPLPELGMTVVQTVVLYVIILAGLKLAGRRVFAERTPQDLITIVLVSEAAGYGLPHEDAGFWASFVSVVTIIFMGAMLERNKTLRKLLSRAPVTIFENGRLDRRTMNRHFIDVDMLDEVAREHTLSSYRDFDKIILEGEGDITGILPRQGPENMADTKKREG